MATPKRIAHIGKDCVACGCCVQVCPRGALQILWGITAQVNSEACIGCGKCANTCPAAVITMMKREDRL